MTGISELISVTQAASVSPEGDGGTAGSEADGKIRGGNVAQDLLHTGKERERKADKKRNEWRAHTAKTQLVKFLVQISVK